MKAGIHEEKFYSYLQDLWEDPPTLTHRYDMLPYGCNFVGTNVHETGQNLGFRNFHGFNFMFSVNLGPVD